MVSQHNKSAKSYAQILNKSEDTSLAPRDGREAFANFVVENLMLSITLFNQFKTLKKNVGIK